MRAGRPSVRHRQTCSTAEESENPFPEKLFKLMFYFWMSDMIFRKKTTNFHGATLWSTHDS